MKPFELIRTSIVALFPVLLFAAPSTCAQQLTPPYHSQPFVHPGIAQNRNDLEFMKKKINSGEEPWKSAFDRLCKASPLSFQPKPFTHVIRGSYGSPAIGGTELSESAKEAYSLALQWYVTRDQKHADKAIEILNAWSSRLWDFDDNDAKLLAGWTGHVFCNAAEILRYSDAGWQQKDITQFKKMLLTAYVPLIKDYFPEANGNWDAAIMDTMLAIAVFCDDHTLFENVIHHYLLGEGNSGITKYIYPNGQCQESTRDQAHTQLGLGELALTCQTAWTQGVDLYGAADNRLALGFEYTSNYMLGTDVAAYGVISPKIRGRFSDIYESVFRHYHDVKGLNMSSTAKAADSVRKKSSIMLLTSVRAPLANAEKYTKGKPSNPEITAVLTGAWMPSAAVSGKVFKVPVGGDIQKALDSCSNTGGMVILDTGLYTLKATLRIPSGITLAGQGKRTVLFVDPNLNPGKTLTAIVNATDELHDVTLRDFVIEGAITPRPSSDPNQDRRQRSYQIATSRAGIIFSSLYDSQMKNIRLDHITVSNCTKNGVVVSGAAKVKIAGCDFSDNGSSVVPGNGIHHNLLLAHVQGAEVTNSRMDTSPWGNGISVTGSKDVTISGNELARNKLNGIYFADTHNITVEGNLIEGNDGTGIVFDKQLTGCSSIRPGKNKLQYNSK